MADQNGTAAQASASGIGAANPLTIAELKLGRKLDPRAADLPQILSSALGKPYEQLFDPKFGSPVFAGLRSIHLPPVIGRPVVHAPTAARATAVAEATAPALTTFRPVVIPPWWPGLFTDLKYAVKGQFIVDVPSATAPVQGALADCWLISAMASVAWCHSDAISERTLVNGNGVVLSDGADYEFTFHASPTWSAGKNLSVKDDIPVSSSGLLIYASSSVAGETWPANVEKAFIGMRGATGFLEPSSTNYDELNYGDAAWAVASLVGRAPYYYNANDPNAWALINSRCSNGRAVDPMTAWTYGTAPAGLSYDGSGVVGNHAYSILGTETSGGTDYVVLRNPWGFHEATVSTLSGSWQGLTLPGDGVFALALDEFARYYAGFGGA
ncbi:MAG: C2 family cysteine protease [Solirubrobacteraceae bacterium]|jgi:hypothetical protein